MWSWTYEPHGSKCKWKPIGGNDTGLKTIIYGSAKTGTTTMARALHDIGLKSYHSEDFTFHVWSPLTDMFYQRPENGAKVFGMSRLATPWPPANRGHSWHWRGGENGSDLKVLREMPGEDIAAAFSRCRIDSTTLDGFENAIEPIYALSPNAKVIVLDWRTFQEYRKSLTNFGIGEALGLLVLNFVVVSMHILPWNAFVIPWLDPLLGNVVETKMRTGDPFHGGTLGSHNAQQPLLMLWRMQLTERRTCQHWNSGFGIFFGDAEEDKWDKFWQRAKDIVPAERRFHFNMRKHGYKDLCKFLNITGNPFCNKEGPLPNGGISIMNHERENLKSLLIVCSYLLFLHYLSFHIFWCIVPILSRKFMSPLKILFPSSKTKKE